MPLIYYWEEIFNRLDFDAVIVFRTDPIHPARHIPVLHDLSGNHGGAALRTHMCMRLPLIAKARPRRFGNLFCHLDLPPLLF